MLVKVQDEVEEHSKSIENHMTVGQKHVSVEEEFNNTGSDLIRKINLFQLKTLLADLYHWVHFWSARSTVCTGSWSPCSRTTASRPISSATRPQALSRCFYIWKTHNMQPHHAAPRPTCIPQGSRHPPAHQAQHRSNPRLGQNHILSEKVLNNNNVMACLRPTGISYMFTNTSITSFSIWSTMTSMKGAFPPTTEPHTQHYKSIFEKQKPIKHSNMHH